VLVHLQPNLVYVPCHEASQAPHARHYSTPSGAIRIGADDRNQI